MKSMKRVVVTGIGVIAPNGVGKDRFWEQLFAGKSYIKQDSSMVEMGINSTVNCSLEEFDILQIIEGPLGEYLKTQDRFIQFGVGAGLLAAADAGFTSGQAANPDIGLIFSSAIGGTPTVQKMFEEMSANGSHEIRHVPVGDKFYNSGMFNYPATLLAHHFGFQNLCTSLSTGCTAGIDAMGMSYETIRLGEAKVMLAGASEAPLTELTYATLDVIGSLSVAQGDPATASRPFDKTRAGFVIGEGSGVIVLEELGHALERKAHIYGEILSYASVNNAFHMTDLQSNGDSMAAVIERVLHEGEVRPETIDYINAHGSSTPQNDIFETNAYKKIFGDYAYQIPISSTKSMIGHSLSSASLMGVIAVLGGIEHSRVHPTANLSNPDEQCDLNYVPHTAIDHPINRALITASGFGGIHSASVIEGYGKVS
jgi:minimal PKS ketosynthase (KS/KS alpha)